MLYYFPSFLPFHGSCTPAGLNLKLTCPNNVYYEVPTAELFYSRTFLVALWTMYLYFFFCFFSFFFPILRAADPIHRSGYSSFYMHDCCSFVISLLILLVFLSPSVWPFSPHLSDLSFSLARLQGRVRVWLGAMRRWCRGQCREGEAGVSNSAR